MRVLLISHTCQSRREGQPKAHCLAQGEDLRLHVLIPDRWKAYGQWLRAQTPAEAEFEYTIARPMWPWIPKAQVFLHWYPGLKRLIREFRPDIIDVWEEPWGLISAQVAYLRNRHFPQVKFVSETEQNTDKRLPFPFESFRRYTIRNADYVIGRNAESIEILRRRGYRGPARVVPNAVDAAMFRPMDRQEAKRRLGIPGILAGYVGRLTPDKGLMDLVEALPRTPPEVQAVLVGAGEYGRALQERAAALGCAGRLHVLPARPLEALPALMNALDVLVLPSRTTRHWKEQFGRVIIEAQACGVPVIGSNSGAIPEVVGDGGILFPEGDAEKLAGAIRWFCEAPERRRRMGSRGRQRVEEAFTWQRVAEQMREVYREVLKSQTLPREASDRAPGRSGEERRGLEAGI